MNDPGLHEPAQEAAEHVEDDNNEQQAEEEEEDYLDPSRYWFASTASPLIAGTFGPVANAFSVCALVEKWRVFIPTGADEGHAQKLEDPKSHRLIAINSISLIFALTSNLALLLNMGRRLSFAVGQPITIVGWYLASFLLIGLVSAASTSTFQSEPHAQHALTQAYYYAIMAAALYFIIASLMVFTVYGAYKGHYPKEFRLTSSQRTLMLQTIGFMMYILLGALVFSKIEGWPFLDGVYWADFTCLTVGIGGEFVPKTHTGRSLLFPYAIGGIVMVGLVIGSVRSLVLERGKAKMSARFMETKREKVLSSLDTKQRTIKIGLFEKIGFSEKDLSESQRREQEFRVMRRIQEISERNRRYTALAISSTAALLLWFLGAVVFMHSEKPQGWSYFVSLYFAYTSLLTVGYGDYYVISNSGKPFFVFWSLLAVPTLTILISNMGDTVIKGFKDATIWIGSLTVLPDENGLAATLKTGLKRWKRGELYEKGEEDTHGSSEKAHFDRLGKHIKEGELEQAEEAGEHGDYLQRDIHFYHFILAKEIRNLIDDVDVSPPKQYTYQEWTFFLRLIGQDERDSALHRKPEVEHKRSKHSSPALGVADGGEADNNESTWSWLGIRSPLMGTQTEAQWLVSRLTATLELEMKRMSSHNAAERNHPPPISLRDLKKHRSKSSGSGSDSEKILSKDLSAAEVRRRGPNNV
ncbi:hypothetical protein BDV95DRAFT_481923 [Massariosphaeria phaeospora]|uniref:Potassium channel domain-containing protein n=1 Tax=Massariosphaeria phaeospora TaxID=100035 RepID=A0A7C8IDK2_9PLEO|nr:hypothetical protein BDV95DRAFT_481923 [Massariosphaeria phaeospora]